MAEAEKPQWKPENKANTLSKEEYRGIRKLAESNKIALSNVKNFDGSAEIVKESIQTLAALQSKFRNIADDRHRLTLEFSRNMSAEDFAETRGRIITLNANAYRDINLLQAEYQKSVDDGWFVKGTNYKAIIHHEFGHVVADIYKINPLKMACEITGMNTARVIKFVKENLSTYAGKGNDGGEIIAEVFADMSTDNPSEFSRKFYEKVLEAVHNA